MATELVERSVSDSIKHQRRPRKITFAYRLLDSKIVSCSFNFVGQVIDESQPNSLSTFRISFLKFFSVLRFDWVVLGIRLKQLILMWIWVTMSFWHSKYWSSNGPLSRGSSIVYACQSKCFRLGPLQSRASGGTWDAHGSWLKNGRSLEFVSIRSAISAFIGEGSLVGRQAWCYSF